MKDLLDKLSSYNIFNNLLPGTMFAYLASTFTSYSLVQNNLLIGLFLYYFVGLIISRIGSLTLEPLLKGVKFVKFVKYEKFVAASKLDPKIELFSELNNMYRTLCSLPILLGVLKIYDELIKDKLPGGVHANYAVLLIGLLAIFLFSYKRQTNYIVKRVKGTLKTVQE